MKREHQRGDATFFALLLAIGILFFGIWYINSPYFPLSAEKNLTPEDEAQRIKDGAQHSIEITGQGFVPEHVTIKPFDTVTFINKDTALHQPVSPCEGLSAPRPLVQNETFSVAFLEPKTCTFSDAYQNIPAGEIKVVR